MSEMRYTQAEIRMISNRRDCELKGHNESQIMGAAPWGLIREEPPVPSGERTFECANCDGVVTVFYPVIGVES